MAILNSIRKRGIFLIIIIALALFAFIIGDLFRQGGFSSKNQNVVGVVNGTEIERTTFNRQVEGQRGRTTVQSVKSVWDQQVRAIILNEQIDEAGIEVSDEQLSNYFRQNYSRMPQFQDENGNFSEVKYNTYISQLENDPSSAAAFKIDKENAANFIAQQQFFAMLKAGIIGTNLEGETEYKFNYDKRDLTYVNVPYSSVSDEEAEVSKSEIQAYMDKHPEQFKAEAQRNIKYVLFEDMASDDDISKLDEELTELATDPENKLQEPSLSETDDVAAFIARYSEEEYDESYKTRKQLGDQANAIFSTTVGKTYGPYKTGDMMKVTLVEDKQTIKDSVENRHILVAYQGATRAMPTLTRTKEDAKAVADSIFKIIGKDSTRFNQQYDRLLEMDSIAQPQDIGWVIKSGNAKNYAKPYADYLFANEAGDIGLVESDFGYHIILIENKTAPTEMVKLATVAMEMVPSKRTGNTLYNTAQKFQQKALQENFDAAAEEFNKEVKPVKELTALDETLPGISKPERRIVQWAFEEEREVGDIERFDTSDGFVIVQMTKATEEGTIGVEDASAEVLKELRNKKKAEIIKAKISGTTIEQVAANQNQKIQTSVAVTRATPKLKAGDEPYVVGAAFGLEEGTASKPLTGEAGVYVVKVTKIDNAPELPSYKTDAQQAASAQANRVTNQLIEALKKSADIEDRRADFY